MKLTVLLTIVLLTGLSLPGLLESPHRSEQLVACDPPADPPKPPKK